MKTPEQIIVNLTDKTQWTLTRVIAKYPLIRKKRDDRTAEVFHIYRGRKGKEIVMLTVTRFSDISTHPFCVELEKCCLNKGGDSYSRMWWRCFWCSKDEYDHGHTEYYGFTERERRLSKMLHQNLVENGMLD
jgi:hypothetical protein